MAQLRWKWQRFFLVVSFTLLVIPNMAVWLARFFLVRELGLFNTHLALILPSLMGTSPLFILLFYWNFRTIPAELFEAAHLDGAGPFVMWWQIALPLSRATIIVVGILTFLFYWGDFVSPMFYLKSQELYTLPVGLRQLQELDRTNWPLLLAGSVVMTLPAVLLFSVVQRYFLQENRLGGIDGQ
jgi:multiple sugar transport system permease protein